MSKTPEFIEFAAIQIFVSLCENSKDRYEVDAVEAWRLAKMLYDARPVEDEQADEPEDDHPLIGFDFVVDDLGNYGVYRDGLFVLEASNTIMETNYRDHLITELNLSSETCIIATLWTVPVVVGSWPKLYEEAKKIGHAGPY